MEIEKFAGFSCLYVIYLEQIMASKQSLTYKHILAIEQVLAQIKQGAEPEQAFAACEMTLERFDSFIYACIAMRPGGYDFSYNPERNKPSEIYQKIGTHVDELQDLVTRFMKSDNFMTSQKNHEREERYKEQRKLARGKREAAKENERLEQLPELVKHAIDVISLFVSSDCTRARFISAVGIRESEFDKLGDVVREHSVELGQVLDDTLEANSRKYYNTMRETAERTVENIKNGVQRSDGKTTPFTLFDYSLTELPSFDDLMDFAKREKIGPGTLTKFREDRRPQFGFQSMEQILREKITIGDHEVTEQDKMMVLEFLKYEGLDTNIGNYSGALRHYVKNGSFPQVKYGASHRQRRKEFFQQVRDEYEQIGASIDGEKEIQQVNDNPFGIGDDVERDG